MLSTKEIFRALQYKNYRLFFTGQLFSLVGTWMQQVAMGWLVYRLTHSAFLLGIVAFCSQLPMLVMGLWGGVVADRFSKQRVIVATQTLSALQAAVLAALTLAGVIEVWEILALSLFLGIVNAVDIPARQAFIVELVDRKDLTNAIALNSTIFNSARLIGPSIAGITVAVYGEGVCFLINSISFLVVIGCLLVMQLAPRPVAAPKGSYLERLKEGVSYAWHTPRVKALLILMAISSIAGSPYTVLMPVFAGKILHGGAALLGYLMGAIGMGALTGALVLARRNTQVEDLDRNVWKSAAAFGLVLILFSGSSKVWISLLILPLAGFSLINQLVSTNTYLQSTVPDELRGRVMSLYAMMFIGLTPIGSLFAGVVSHHIGVQWTVAICGVICLTGGLLLRLTKEVGESGTGSKENTAE